MRNLTSRTFRFVSSTLAASSLALWGSVAAADNASPPPVAPAAPTTVAAASDSPSSPTDITQTSATPAPITDLPTTDTQSPINRPLLLTSVLVLGGTYGASAIVGAESNRPSDQNNLYYPVVGPWMDLANRDCNARPCGNDTLATALLIADGVGQGLGALGVVTSLFIPEKTTRHWYLLGNDTVHAAPTHIGVAGYGIGAAGTF